MIRIALLNSRHYLTKAVIIVAAACATLGCSDMGPDKSGTFYGPAVTIASGSGRSYVILDRSGLPTDLGVSLTETTLTGLPGAAAEFSFALPQEASATAFKHVVMNWQAAGHGAPGTVYAVPHFDVHFYMVTPSEREAMVLGDAQLAAKMTRAPAAEFIPAGYVAGMALQRMGMHWTNPAAPESNGQLFTHTFFYGSYDGAFMLNEPMVTKAYLETKPSAVVTPLKLPAQYATRGYQPTSYTVAYDADTKVYRIALSNLVER